MVRSNDTITGTITGQSGATPINVKNDYTDWLPNANVNVHFGRDWQLRLAATKTRTRPQFSDLNPALSIAAPITGCGATTTCFRTGSGGNPYLKPFTSFNLDASLEYYFSPTGFASIGVFHRDIRGFIATELVTYPDPTATGVTLLLTGPVNTNKGKIKGFEAQIRTFFDWASVPSWARSFGIDANVTRIDAHADFNILQDPLHNNPGLFITAPLTDVSKWTFNVTGMYERGPLSVRLSWNRRTSYPEGPFANNLGSPGYTLQGLAHPSSRLDLSTNFNVTDQFSIFADWTNILPHAFHSDIVRNNYSSNGSVASTEVFPMVVRFEETVLSGGIRFNFGGRKRAAPLPPPPVMAPPPPPPPPVEQPAPPPPPPPAPPAPERGS